MQSESTGIRNGTEVRLSTIKQWSFIAIHSVAILLLRLKRQARLSRSDMFVMYRTIVGRTFYVNYKLLISCYAQGGREPSYVCGIGRSTDNMNNFRDCNDRGANDASEREELTI